MVVYEGKITNEHLIAEVCDAIIAEKDKQIAELEKDVDTWKRRYREIAEASLSAKRLQDKQIAELKELLMKYHDYDLTRHKPIDAAYRSRAEKLLEQGE